MSTDCPRYKHIDNIERLDYYKKGGYHPIQIGDRFHKREKWEAKTKTESFDGNGTPKPGRVVRTFEQRFEDSIQQPRREDGMDVINDEEKKALFGMVKGMLKFSSSGRMSVQQILETEWMRKRAIPAAEKSWGTADRE